MTAKEDATHALRAVGRICDTLMVFGVFHDNQASVKVQQQLGVKVQQMRLCLREWNGHLVRGHDVAYRYIIVVSDQKRRAGLRGKVTPLLTITSLLQLDC